MEFLKDSHWVWCEKWSSEDKVQPRVVFFRREVDIEDAPVSSKVQISADSRYKLYVNGKLAEVGSSKGESAKPYIRLDVPGSISPGNLIPRMITFMYRKRRTFVKMMDLKKTEHSEEECKSRNSTVGKLYL